MEVRGGIASLESPASTSHFIGFDCIMCSPLDWSQWPKGWEQWLVKQVRVHPWKWGRGQPHGNHRTENGGAPKHCQVLFPEDGWMEERGRTITQTSPVLTFGVLFLVPWQFSLPHFPTLTGPFGPNLVPLLTSPFLYYPQCPCCGRPSHSPNKCPSPLALVSLSLSHVFIVTQPTGLYVLGSGNMVVFSDNTKRKLSQAVVIVLKKIRRVNAGMGEWVGRKRSEWVKWPRLSSHPLRK